MTAPERLAHTYLPLCGSTDSVLETAPEVSLPPARWIFADGNILTHEAELSAQMNLYHSVPDFAASVQIGTEIVRDMRAQPATQLVGRH